MQFLNSSTAINNQQPSQDGVGGGGGTMVASELSWLDVQAQNRYERTKKVLNCDAQNNLYAYDDPYSNPEAVYSLPQVHRIPAHFGTVAPIYKYCNPHSGIRDILNASKTEIWPHICYRTRVAEQ